MKNRLLSIAGMLALVAGQAVAADLPSLKAPPEAPPVFTWNGFYAGVAAGGVWGPASVSQPGFESAKLNGSSGALAGLAGYNMQFGQFVAGVEGEMGWQNTTGSANFIDGSSGLPYNASLNSEYEMRIRGRVGYAFGNALIFAAGGLSVTGERVNLGGPGGYATVRNDLTGYNIGGGVDYAFAPNWVARVEYIRDNYNTLPYNFSGASANNLVPFNDRLVSASNNTIRASLIYNFGPGGAPGNQAQPADPNYTTKALDSLGDNFFERLVNYYKLEWGHDAAPTDPSAPPSRRADWPPAPETSPPMPFFDYSYGGTTNLGTNRTASVDSPLMVALAPSPLGKFMSDWGIQAYGWVNAGANASTSKLHDGGNFPAAYMYSPNTVSLDQAVMYVERTPDTVQKDHIDWGFRFSTIYGENYRYTTSYGVASWQLLNHNDVNGYDFPMVWGEIFIPQVAEGMLVRVGRFISLPDIEAQLAPNNYMYSHSMTYAFDNYTNNGVQASIAVTKNLFIQPGISLGSDTAVWNNGAHLPNLAQSLPGYGTNPLYPNSNYLKDPGNVPSFTLCLRYQTDTANDNIYLCGDAFNKGQWGYNNLQWFGGTYYHRFNDQWHIAFESYNLHETHVPNNQNAEALAFYAAGGTPFSPQYIPFNAPGTANCRNTVQLYCNSDTQTFLTYLNYQFSPLDNLSLRAEYFSDMTGQRTGVATNYAEWALGWQHWFSPQIEVRPEVAYYRSFQANAFNGNSNFAIAPNKNWEVVAAGDIIWHF
ncbi:outer membrane beta-barrel protein [Rhodoblastus sp.]|uniref:outer membrane beta-barrel protein n=1 Tax=Rhodoblastus sp. TaxID=1962975 RepID=UPI003F993ED7